jgi:hypothetical protein
MRWRLTWVAPRGGTVRSGGFTDAHPRGDSRVVSRRRADRSAGAGFGWCAARKCYRPETGRGHVPGRAALHASPRPGPGHGRIPGSCPARLAHAGRTALSVFVRKGVAVSGLPDHQSGRALQLRATPTHGLGLGELRPEVAPERMPPASRRDQSGGLSPDALDDDGSRVRRGAPLAGAAGGLSEEVQRRR